jgi:Alpha-glutamyl/putrescinyl thymine pyrophosphorylase clade 3
VPTFCRHNRFIERCPICSKTLPGRAASAGSPPRAKAPARARQSATGAARRRVREERVRVHREGRAEDDGYRSALVPGLRASADASRLAHEISFSSGRLLALAVDPPGLYADASRLAREDLERASWMCFLIVYLCPLETEDPFAGIRAALDGERGALPDLDGIPLGPRTSHDPGRGGETLLAYRQWLARGGRASVSTQPQGGAGTQAVAFTGDPAWSPQRRFERVFERLALPGFMRMGRYDLLVTLGRLGLYELLPDSLALGGARGLSAEDPTTVAAKRVFGIGDPLLLERRAAALAQAVSVPIETLDLALANWIAPQPATMGFPPQTRDDGALERALGALEL